MAKAAFGWCLVLGLALVGCDDNKEVTGTATCAANDHCAEAKEGEYCEFEPPPCAEEGEFYICNPDGEWEYGGRAGSARLLDDGGTDGGN